MATPVRRSSRLRGSGTPQTQTGTPDPVRRLDSLMERDETPNRVSSITALITSTPGRALPGAFVDVKTPEQQPTLPSHEEMHPEHAHQSTKKVSNVGLKLGFSDVNPYQSSPLRPSHPRMELSPIAVPNAQSSPGYQFNFNRESQDMTAEAQRIMMSVREEAARIRERMREEREEQRRLDAEAGDEAGISGRKIAKPKSRFSDVHKAEFSKMDSIASHASLWRSKLQGSKQPAKAEVRKVEVKPELKATPTSTLKRTHSKLDLMALKTKVSTPNLKRTQSKADIKESVKESKKPLSTTSTPRQDTSPVKRRKTTVTQDVSSQRPTSSGTPSTRGHLPPLASTPTKASLARSQSVRNLKGSKLPTPNISRTKSLRNLANPSNLRTASGRLATSVSNKINSIKSILHKPEPKYSSDPAKIAAGTHLPMPEATPPVEEGTPGLPATPRPHHTLPRATPKRVEFAPDTKGTGTPLSTKSAARDQATVARSIERSVSVSPAKSAAFAVDDVPTPKAGVPTPKPASVGRHSLQTRPAPLFSNPPTAGDFTFTHQKRIQFSSVRPTESGSPARGNLTTIRPVGAPGMPVSVVVSPSRVRNPVGQPHLIYGVPHGIANKKRAREGEVDSSDVENVDPRRQAEEESAEQGSPRKRAKMSVPEIRSTPIKSASKIRRQTGVPGSQQKKKGLSLSRLNFLSTPKSRR